MSQAGHDGTGNQSPVSGLSPAALRQRVAEGRQLLAGHPIGADEHERGLSLLREAAGSGDLEAQWLLGAYFLTAPARAGALADAWQCLGQAAAAGVAPAMDRLADLQLRGLDRPADPTAALRLHRQLADRGYYRSAWEAGYLIDQGADGAGVSAASMFARACALGYPQAYYSLGLRFALGAGAPRDGAFARALLLRAADGRFAGARETADELVPAAEHGAAVDWHARLKRNLDDAQPMLERLRPADGPTAQPLDPLLPRLEAHLSAIGHAALAMDASGRLAVAGGGGMPALRADIGPWRSLAPSPRVALAPGFATREECAHLINKVGGQLTGARGYHGSGSANDDAELVLFSGEGTPIRTLQSDSVVRTLEHRLTAATGWPVAKMEPCSIIRYQPGQDYRPHVDFFTAEQIAENRRVRGDQGGQRIATFLLYLRTPDQGGETHYLHADLRVVGTPGTGVLHYNVTPDGAADPRSLHSGTAIVRGEKWLWRSTLREHPLVDDGST